MEKEKKQDSKIIRKVLKEADEKCPLPYIQLDCTMEEYVAQIGAISLEDFMKKVSEKYGV